MLRSLGSGVLLGGMSVFSSSVIPRGEIVVFNNEIHAHPWTINALKFQAGLEEWRRGHDVRWVGLTERIGRVYLEESKALRASVSKWRELI